MTEHKATPPVKRRRKLYYLFLALLVVLVALAAAWWTMIRMPGTSFHGELAALDQRQETLKAALRRDVTQLAVEIGQRNLDHYPQLVAAANYIDAELSRAGFEVRRQSYVEGRTRYRSENLEVEIPGSALPKEIVLVGAHYDSALGTPGANDNASGVAGLLALARALSGREAQRTIRLVAFTNEEMPYFQTKGMGSRVYARRCREREENLTAIVVLETIGYYSDRRGSQRYPPPLASLYPAQGDFIAVVGNVGSRRLVRRIVEMFRRHGEFPSEGGALPGQIDGVGWSDHWSFWQEGYEAVMVTDTAPFRYPFYHHPEDTPDKLDFDRMARVVAGLTAVVEELAGVEGANEPRIP